MPLFRTCDDFWLDNPHRWLSPESDYGVHWRTSAVPGVRWRVSYIKDTGEIYAIRQATRDEVWLLGRVTPDPVAPGREWQENYYRTLDKILDGWADPEISAFDLGWIIGRLAGARATV